MKTQKLPKAGSILIGSVAGQIFQGTVKVATPDLISVAETESVTRLIHFNHITKSWTTGKAAHPHLWAGSGGLGENSHENHELENGTWRL